MGTTCHIFQSDGEVLVDKEESKIKERGRDTDEAVDLNI